MREPEQFDYIVVGAGTAGCVVAARLAEAGAEVLLLEQGSDGTDENIAHANLDHLFRLWKDQNHIFNYPMDPRSTSPSRWPELMRGRTVGGSGAVNVMIHTRANPADLDGWAAEGNSEWSYEKVLPYYKKSETDPAGENDVHGGSGPIQLSRPARTRYADALLDAAGELGFKGPDWDFNGPEQEGGAGLYRFAADHEGRRSSTASAYLEPQRARKNLQVRSDVPVTRVLVDGSQMLPRAMGILYRDPNSWHETPVLARRRVILCAGALESPKLLMLSGIGPADHLSALGIAPVIDLAGVGENLQDHVISGIQFTGRYMPPRLQFLTEVGLFAHVNTSHENGYYTLQGEPTVQFFMNAGIAGRGFPWTPPRYFGIYPSLTCPDTRGSVRLTSADPRRPPVIRMDYLSNQKDMDMMVNGLRLALELGGTQALAGVDAEAVEIPTATGLVKPDLNTPRDVFEKYLNLTARGLWHPAGTCRMGPDPALGAVVAQDLSVHGIDGMSICDASVLPKMTSGNPNATIIASAEKFCAEFVN
ncbi:MAG: GMC family oxidoreductase [Pseudomonadota bacterium]